jgi:hypothetical protein
MPRRLTRAPLVHRSAAFPGTLQLWGGGEVGGKQTAAAGAEKQSTRTSTKRQDWGGREGGWPVSQAPPVGRGGDVGRVSLTMRNPDAPGKPCASPGKRSSVWGQRCISGSQDAPGFSAVRELQSLQGVLECVGSCTDRRRTSAAPCRPPTLGCRPSASARCREGAELLSCQAAEGGRGATSPNSRFHAHHTAPQRGDARRAHLCIGGPSQCVQ